MFPKNKQDKLRNEEEWDKRRKLFKAKATYFFAVQAVSRIISGCLVSKIIVFRVSFS